MFAVEALFVDIVVRLFEVDAINDFFRDPRTTARIIGVLIAVAGGVLGTFLLLRGMALTSDAISHTVLLGIVVAFMVMTRWFGAEPDLSSPWLIVGAAAAGVATVVLTEIIQHSGLMRQDAALGLAFPFLFALAIIFIARYVDNVHMDDDAVMVGEIGVAWANTNSHCIGACEEVVITEDDPRAIITRRCTNCVADGISPRDPGAEFVEICTNCGTYTPGQAWQAGLAEERPTLVHWPRSITVTVMMTLLAVAFVAVFYKELKITTFDPSLARSLGYRPTTFNYALMVVVSLVAVAAFDAVGSILVIAFFIIPPASAYLLTNRLSIMALLAAAIGSAGAFWGYDLARGSLFGVVDLPGTWDTSISASMVLMMLLLFVIVLAASPHFGMVAVVLRRFRRRRAFAEFVILGHMTHHRNARELPLATLAGQIRWETERLHRVAERLKRKGFVTFVDRGIAVTPRGVDAIDQFRRETFTRSDENPDSPKASDHR